jgi:hypothetical protein
MRADERPTAEGGVGVFDSSEMLPSWKASKRSIALLLFKGG